MKEAISHYEAALKEAFPSGATGNVFHHWNEARKALEQPAQQEPLFWYKPYPNGMYNGPIHNAQIGDVLRCSEEWIPLYTRPKAREWVGLTDEEIGEIAVKSQDGISPHDDTLRFARAIEAALRSKNT